MVDDYFRWLLEHGVVCEGIHQFVRYKRRAVFGPFRDDITQLRILGDRDRSSEIRALTTKRIGNSTFGSCINTDMCHLVHCAGVPCPRVIGPRRTVTIPISGTVGSTSPRCRPSDLSPLSIRFPIRADLPLSPRGRTPAYACGLRSDATDWQDDLRSGQAVPLAVRL